ncbi:MAG: hypothetical protein B1H03_00465 [Planctomycetales bacterium 4484_113]|nr:MAG: hypothetical protein B1H03_00465 [Planctomycetales bacterium 4484_113]
MNALELWVFVPIGVLAVIGAAGLVAARNPIHSALFLLLNLLSLAAIFLILWSPLMAALQIIVYAGAIMVLFIFVILFFVRPRQVHTMSYSLPLMYALGALLAVSVLGVVLFALYQGGLFNPALPAAAQVEAATSISSPSTLGRGLFSRYLLPFELTSVLLLVAMLGAVVMTRGEPGDGSSREDSAEEAD